MFRLSGAIFSVVLAAVTAIAVAMPGCNAGVASAQPTAVATIFSYYDVLRAVGGDHIHAVLLLPRGTSPHDYDAPAQAKIDVNRAVLIVKNGLGIDPWIDKLAEGTKATIIDVSKDAQILHTAEMSLDAEPSTQEGGRKPAGMTEGGGEGSVGNPHVWLDPYVQMAATERVRDALIKLDPSHEQSYRANANAYLADLKKLDADFRAATKDLKNRDFIGFHSAYDYLAHRYGLHQVAAIEELPGAGLTPAQAQKIIALIKKDNIKVIFNETAFDAKSANLIVRETGVRTAILQPLETYDSLDDTYVSLMRQNLVNLKAALGD